jgi:RNA polymerase sigma factor (sigma-70 family)
MKPPFQEVVKNYINLLYHFAYRWTSPGADVDDIVHESFLKAFKNYDQVRFTSDTQIKSWLLTICRNHIHNIHRIKKMISLEEIDSESFLNESLVDLWLQQLIHEEQIDLVKKELEKMDTYEEEIVRLRIFENLSFKEIGCVLEISEPAAKMRFSRVITKLKEVLL